MYHDIYSELHRVSKYSNCLRRNVAAVIVKDNTIIGEGVNYSCNDCDKTGKCLRSDIESGTQLDKCYAIHAEIVAIACATSKHPTKLHGAEIYVTNKPCVNCMKSIIAHDIIRVYYLEDYNSPLTDELAKLSNIELIKIGSNSTQ
jgi:dCMP deaminase